MAEGKKVLLVDDDEHILRSLRTYLEMESFEVETAGGGAEALQKVGTMAPDLIVLDVMMPQMDGFQVLEALKGQPATENIPIIMLTAKGQDPDVLKGYQRGASCYMTKPVNYNELVDNINLVFAQETINSKQKTYEV
ncbi:MAG TPA: response regulator [Candidatus Xenobia bacterium]|jgi:DNA-binding response OmpR family regulator